jgi:hypothetical protein
MAAMDGDAARARARSSSSAGDPLRGLEAVRRVCRGHLVLLDTVSAPPLDQGDTRI